ncbi:MAG: adenylate kinase, partial [Proteobacteria bacterium]|nr:adenylate kinase [Pseudomonadota bacterium]
MGQKEMRIVLLGAPGVGKGTQANIIAERQHVAHVASGDLFRKHLGEGSDLGKLAKTYMDKGELVPDDVTIKMVLDRISEKDAVGGYVLDGFPRTVAQADALDVALAEQGQALDLTPLVEVDTGELVRRLAGRWICRTCQKPYHEITAPPKKSEVCDDDGGVLYQRDDDKTEVVRARFEIFEKQTAPLIGYYEQQGKLVRVNGQQDVDKVTADLLDVIAKGAV